MSDILDEYESRFDNAVVTPFGEKLEKWERYFWFFIIALALLKDYFNFGGIAFNLFFFLYCPYFLFRAVAGKLIFRFPDSWPPYVIVALGDLGKASVMLYFFFSSMSWPGSMLFMLGGLALCAVSVLSTVAIFNKSGFGGEQRAVLKTVAYRNVFVVVVVILLYGYYIYGNR